MKQIFHHYTIWEDYLNGMWNKLPMNEEEKMLYWAIAFTGDDAKYGAAMLRVIESWPTTWMKLLNLKIIMPMSVTYQNNLYL